MKKNKLSTLITFVCICVLSFAAITFVTFSDARFSITFFNIGHGDAFFIKTPNNGQILIDGGPTDEVLGKIGQKMWPWDRELDLVFISHLHADHITGVVEVLKHYRVKKLLVNGYDYDSPVVDELISLVDSTQTSVQTFYKGDEVLFDGVMIKSLWPEKGAKCLNINDCAQVLHVSFNDFDAVLTSDVELSRINIDESFDYSVEVLKVPHQGNPLAINEKGLELINPKYAIFSVGENNYGHPSPETVRLFSSHGVVNLRTDELGDLEFWVNKDDDKVHLSITK